MKKGVILLGAVILLAVFALLPVVVLREQNGPREDPTYIRRVWGDNTVGQTFHTNHAIDSITILVRSKQPQSRVLKAVNDKGETIASEEIETTAADRWVHFEFTKPIPKGDHTITFQAPGITSEDNSIDIRYQVDSSYYVQGNMVVNGKASYGDIAFRTYERVPFWQAVIVRGQITDKSVTRAAVQAGLGVILAGIIVVLTLNPSKRKLLLAFALLSIFAFALRTPYTHHIEGVFGGDAFNYYSKAKALVDGKDFFAADPRKGPMYSILLVPGLWQRDPLLWSRLVGITAAVVAVVLTTLSARLLALSWPLAFGAGLLLAVNPEFIWEAPNGLANSLYAAGIIAACWAYLSYVSTDAKKWLWWLAVFLGLTALTRYEGVLVAAVLLPAAFLHKPKEWRAVGTAVVLAAAIMAIPFISYVWSGVSGIRTIGDLESDHGLYIISSPEGVEANLSRAQGFFAGMWLQFEKLQPVLPPYILGMVLAAGVAGILQAYRNQRSVLRTILLILILGSVMVFMAMKNPFIGRNTLIAYSMLAAGAGSILLIFTKYKKAMPLFLVALLQTIIIIFILPKSRYFIQVLPFISIAMAASLQALAGFDKSKVRKALAVLIITVFASNVLFSGFKTLSHRIEVYNTDASEKSVLLNALELLRNDHGRVAYFATTAEQPVAIYIQDNRRVPFRPEANNTPEKELAFLRENRVRYILARERELPHWQSIKQYPDAFERVHVFESIYGEDKVFVYEVFNEKFPK